MNNGPTVSGGQRLLVIHPHHLNDAEALIQAVRENQGRYLAVCDRVRTVAGNWAPELVTIMEFPTREQALTAHTASGYEATRQRGNNAAMIDMVILSGRKPGETA